MIDEEKAAANRAARRARKQEHLRALYDVHVEHFRGLKGQDALTIARDAQAAIDDLLVRDLGETPGAFGIRCAKGCNHCCRGPIEIGSHEAALLVATVRAAGRTLDEALLDRQSSHSVETWREQPVADRVCMFLGDDGACTVYAFRPLACRKLLVLSDPVFCDAEQKAMDRIDRWFSWEAEMMASAALEVFGMTLMPRALLAAWRD